MINSNINPAAEIITGKVELYNSSTEPIICTCEDVLQDFTVERVGENGKFFGFGVCQKTNINLIDIDRNIDVSTANTIKNFMGVDGEYISPYPTFYVTEVNRDEGAGTISITAYDILYRASKYTLEDLVLPTNYSLYDLTELIAEKIGAIGVDIYIDVEEFYIMDGKGNFNGTENLRSILNAIAEVTQTIYYVNNEEMLVFKRLDKDGRAVATITSNDYYILDSKTNRRLTNITNATELGDNVSADMGISGTTQFVRNNPFWELRDDIGELLENALANIGGLTINQFSMNWSGNFLLEICDKIAITLDDGSLAYSYILNDVVRFLGYVDEDTEWIFGESENETASNPSTLGEVLKQTTARVDKVNQEIKLIVQQSQDNIDTITELALNANSISTSVSSLETIINENTKNVEELQKEVAATMTNEEIEIAINTRLESGVDKVETITGFTFNEEGLTVSRSDSDISTTITEDGMSVNKGSAEVLTANNEGVKAIDLHATTYLIVGNNSRFEDYGNRTGCYWIGG